MSVHLPLGPRPDEPGPPIGGPASYPPDVADRLAADAAGIIARSVRGTVAEVDMTELYMHQLDRVLGVLLAMTI